MIGLAAGGRAALLREGKGMRAFRIPIVAAALAAPFAGAAPATAADVGQLTCPVDALSEAERTHLVEAVRRQTERQDPIRSVFYRSAMDCRARHGWTLAAAELAIVYHIADIGQGIARTGLEERGVDVAAIERALLADAAAVASAREDDRGEGLVTFFEGLDPELRRSVERLGGQGAELIGQYLLFRAAMETSRADFAAN